MPSPTAPEAARYYHAAALGLGALERREGRALRFGADADARWERFRGALHDADRLDMLLRDASVTWTHAFAAARVFQLTGVAADDPFGPQWLPTSKRRATELLDTAAQADPTLDDLGRALGIDPTLVPLPDLGPASRIHVGGGAAILALAKTVQARHDLDWAQQVTVIADRPAHRQLAGLVAVLVGAVRPAPLHASAAAPPPTGVRVCSPDADPAVRQHLQG